MQKAKASSKGKDGDIFELSNFFTLVCSFDNDEQIPLDLFTACLIGDYAVVQQCINANSDLDCKNRGGWTPLMYAAYVGRDTIVNLLLDAGAPVDTHAATCKGGMTALMLSASCGIESVSYFLLQHGASINARDNSGCTALFHAVRQGHMNVVKLLIDSGADIELGHKSTDLTPLMQAALEGHEIIFNILVENGADVNRKSRLGETSRSLAIRYGNTTIVNVIDAYISKPSNNLRREPLLNEDAEMETTDKDIGLRAGQAALAKMIKGDAGAKKKDALDVPDSPTILTNREMTSPINLHDYSGSDTEADATDAHPQQPGADPKADHPMSFKPLTHPKDPIGNHNATAFTPPDGARQPHDNANRHIKFSRICTEHPQNVPIIGRQLSKPDGTLPASLGELLEELNLGKYYPCFKSQNVDLKGFLMLTGEDLKALGIDKLGARKRMLTAIEKINKEQKEFASTMEVSGAPQIVEPGHLVEDPKHQLQKALAYTKQLSAELQKEQQSRRDLEKFFVTESIRLQKIYAESKVLESATKEAENALASARIVLQTCASDHNVISDQQHLKRMLKSLDSHIINGSGMLAECGNRVAQIKIALKSDPSEFNRPPS